MNDVEILSHLSPAPSSTIQHHPAPSSTIQHHPDMPSDYDMPQADTFSFLDASKSMKPPF